MTTMTTDANQCLFKIRVLGARIEEERTALNALCAEAVRRLIPEHEAGRANRLMVARVIAATYHDLADVFPLDEDPIDHLMPDLYRLREDMTGADSVAFLIEVAEELEQNAVNAAVVAHIARVLDPLVSHE